MVSYNAKVSHGQIVIDGVDLPHGTAVRVQVERVRWVKTPWGFVTPEVAEDLRTAEREIRRGETFSAEEVLAELREHNQELLRARRGNGAATARSGKPAVGRGARNRSKPARKRAR